MLEEAGDNKKDLLELKQNYGDHYMRSAFDGAVCCGSVKIIREILTNQTDDKMSLLQLPNQDGLTPLLAATSNSYNEEEVINTICGLITSAERMTLLKIKNKFNYTPLARAIYLDNLDAIRAFLKNLTIDQKMELLLDYHNDKSIFLRSDTSLETVKAVLEELDDDHKIKLLNTQDKHGWTMFQNVILNGSIEIAKTILEALGDRKSELLKHINNEGKTLLHLFIELEYSNHLSIIFELLENAEKIELLSIGDNEGNTALHVIRAYDDPYAITDAIFSELGIGIMALLRLQNKQGETPLHVAVKYDQVQSANAILSKLNFDQKMELYSIPDKQSKFPLHIAADMEGVDLFNVMFRDFSPEQKIKAINILDKNRHTVLYRAVISRKTTADKINILFEGLTIDQKMGLLKNQNNIHQYTLLHLAVMYNNTATISKIFEGLTIEQKIELLKNQNNIHQYTPLHLAIIHKNADAINKIFEGLTSTQKEELLAIRGVEDNFLPKDYTSDSAILQLLNVSDSNIDESATKITTSSLQNFLIIGLLGLTAGVGTLCLLRYTTSWFKDTIPSIQFVGAVASLTFISASLIQNSQSR